MMCSEAGASSAETSKFSQVSLTNRGKCIMFEKLRKQWKADAERAEKEIKAFMLATATLLLIGACLIVLDKIGAVKMIIGGVIK